jgi:hypothetical protein
MRLIDKDATVKALREDPVGFNLSAKNNVDGWIEARPDVEAIPLDWIRGYIDRLKDMGVVISIRDAQAVSVMVDKYMMEQSGNATCGPDYCEIGGTHND